MSDHAQVFPVILSGGSGTRLWPLSRALYPKQFIRFFNGQSSSFLGSTLKRLSTDKGFAPPILLANNDHRFLVREDLDRAGANAKAIILEPVARNTAPAIAVAALAALAETRDAIIAVMPSDHVVKD
ncbi:MAG: sugar phosphate nucleotidyltransferase, partial [Hyphomicrobiaceae bacterium]